MNILELQVLKIRNYILKHAKISRCMGDYSSGPPTQTPVPANYPPIHLVIPKLEKADTSQCPPEIS